MNSYSAIIEICLLNWLLATIFFILQNHQNEHSRLVYPNRLPF